MERQQYNRLILKAIEKLVNHYPDLRFGQILINTKIIQYKKEVLCDGQRENLLLLDPFNEESKVTWERMEI